MVFEELFMASKGQPITYNGNEIKMIDKINLIFVQVKIKIFFLATDSAWKQGLILKTKGHFEISNKVAKNKVVFWEDTAPAEFELIVNSKDKTLIIYNVWETEDGTLHYWHNGGALHVEVEGNIRTYYCNDGYPDDDFDDLIFKIEIES